VDLIWGEGRKAILILDVRGIKETRDAVTEEPLGAGLTWVDIFTSFRGSQWMFGQRDSALWMLVFE
jgi:hypothetical protein